MESIIGNENEHVLNNKKRKKLFYEEHSGKELRKLKKTEIFTQGVVSLYL